MATCVINSCGIPSRKRSFEPLEEEEFDLDSQLSAILKKGRFWDYAFPSQDSSCPKNPADDRTSCPIPTDHRTSCPNPTDSEGWADVMIKEMTAASSVDDAKSRATRLVDGWKEAMSETTKTLSEQNRVLKRAVVHLHRFGRELEDKNLEMKQSAAKAEEELKSLKRKNYEFEEELKSLNRKNYELTFYLDQAIRGGGQAAGFNRHVY